MNALLQEPALCYLPSPLSSVIGIGEEERRLSSSSSTCTSYRPKNIPIECGHFNVQFCIKQYVICVVVLVTRTDYHEFQQIHFIFCMICPHFVRGE